jgi:hypothetical protein
MDWGRERRSRLTRPEVCEDEPEFAEHVQETFPNTKVFMTSQYSQDSITMYKWTDLDLSGTLTVVLIDWFDVRSLRVTIPSIICLRLIRQDTIFEFELPLNFKFEQLAPSFFAVKIL